MEDLINSLTPEQVDALTNLTSQTNNWIEANAAFVLIALIVLMIWQWRFVAVCSVIWFLYTVFGASA